MSVKNLDKGTEFETQVAALYRSAGYDIKQNYSISGTDFDLLCEKEVAPHIKVSIVVECKFKSGRGKVGPLDVEKLSNKFKYAKDFGITHAVIICNNGFTTAAHIAAKPQNITLRSYSELEDDLLGFAAKFVIAQRKYQTSDIFHEYFGLEGARSDTVTTSDIEEFVIGTLLQTESRGRRFFVLGDFGAGKTTLVDRVNYRLQEAYIRNRTSAIPIVFRLNRLLVENDLRRFVENQLKSELGLDLSVETFNNLMSNGMITLLLDGLDEIESHSDEQAKIYNIARISPFFNSQCDLIVTSRPTMFKTKRQMIMFFNYIEEHESISSIYDNTEIAKHHLAATLDRLRSIVQQRSGQTLEASRLGNSEIISIKPLSKARVISVLHSKKDVLEKAQRMPIDKIITELFGLLPVRLTPA